MTPFPLKIVTPDGIKYDAPAEELVVRTTSGDVGILAGHTPMVAPLGMGRATIIIDGQKRYAACIGGMVAVVNGHVDLVPTSFEWAEDIDPERVKRSMERAQETLNRKDASETDLRLAKARLHRALVRQNVASNK